MFPWAKNRFDLYLPLIIYTAGIDLIMYKTILMHLGVLIHSSWTKFLQILTMLLNLTNILLPIFCLIISYTESAEKDCEKDFYQENGVQIYLELNGLDQYDPKVIEKLRNDILVKPKKGPLNSVRPPQPQNLKGRGDNLGISGIQSNFVYEQ